MPDYDTLQLDRDGDVLTITLDAGPHNGLDPAMTADLHRVAVSLHDEDPARAVVLTHDGDVFSAGADLTAFEGDETDAPYVREMAGQLHDAVLQFHRAPVPIVAGVDGVAAGAGFSLAIFPDLLVLSEDARLEYAYHRIGLTGDGGSTFFLPRLVGLRRAKEILLLDEPIAPEAAVDLGLATEVVAGEEFDERLAELAADLAAGPTHAFGTTTRLMTESFDRSLESQLADETEAIADATRTEDFARGHAAFFGDGPPEFVGR